MFGKEKIRALEDQLNALKGKMNTAEKEKKELEDRLNGTKNQLQAAKAKIEELEKKVAESELTELQEKARQTIVEYEGLKELYLQKNREIDATRESTEEGFAREAATKRHDLAEEIEQNREENREMVTETVKTFAGSYRYYLDQIRALMDALSEAAKETGENLFKGESTDIRASFGTRIVERLRDDADSLRQNTGDKLLIGAEEEPVEEPAAEACEACEEAAEEVKEEACEACEETVEEAAEEACEACGEAAEEVKEEACEACEEAAEAVQEAAEEACGEAAEEVKEVAEEAVEAVQETAEEAAEESREKIECFEA